MESLLNQSRAMCPFLKHTSPAALRSMSMTATATAVRPSAAGPRGGTMSNLQVIARRCPVMSKALAVQSSRLASSKRFTAALSAAPEFKNLAKVGGRCPMSASLHTTAGNGASVEVGAYEKNDKRELFETSPFLSL
jgi:5-aminolevulinate synthase